MVIKLAGFIIISRVYVPGTQPSPLIRKIQVDERVDTLIIGAGQAGLSLSYYLTQQQRPHVLLEKAGQLAEAWRNHRWDSFTLVTPNWHIRLPGGEYQGNNPEGYMPRVEVVSYLERYAASFEAPVRFEATATAVESAKGGFRVRTNQGDFQAINVVIATGLFQQPKIPPFSVSIPNVITQLHSGEYRNPEILPSGAVLVVGSGQSGCQIAEELYQSGRKVYLCVGGSAGRAPRRYRGQDSLWWLVQMGFFNRTVDQLTSPQAKFAANPQISGKAGGHTLNLHKFAREGVSLLGRFTGAEEDRIYLAPDLKENLAKIDKFEVDLVKGIDDFIAKAGYAAPDETLPCDRDGYDVPIITELDMKAAGITSVIWAGGYKFDFSWIHLPVLDADGFPIQQRGVTAFPGLYFLGLPWLHTAKSGLLLGVGEDAAYIASKIEEKGSGRLMSGPQA
jgi:putative flavoprotein involved in K+ transport